ncbi:MAG: ribosome recycling factor [Bacteroidota bacterium]|nr:ribosome recycling factor [Bacteroidota bacterium]
MTEESIFVKDEMVEEMDAAIHHYEFELHKIKAGKASPAMLEGVMVDYYGAHTPIDQVSNINTPDPKSILIQPWDRTMLHAIEKAIINANLGFTPTNTGEALRISLPPLTEERRRELVKKAKTEAEAAKVALRNVRRHANEAAKKLEKDGVAEDEIKDLEKEIQIITDKYITKVDKILESKEKDIMQV